MIHRADPSVSIVHLGRNLFFLGILSVSVLLSLGALVRQGLSALPTSSLEKPPDLYSRDIEFLQGEIENAHSQEEKEFLTKKLEVVALVATQHASRKHIFTATVPADPYNYRPPVTFEGAKKLLGIIDNPSFIFERVFKIENAWQERLGEGYVIVFAGAERDDPAQGVVVVNIYKEGLAQGFWEYYHTPQKDGSLRIVAYKGYRLEMISSAGKTYYFDAAGLNYAASMEEIIPTATPFAPELFPTETQSPAYP
jgi:hypothetical protein